MSLSCRTLGTTVMMIKCEHQGLRTNGSDAGAEMSAVYNSIVSTLRMQERSVWEFFGKYFRGVATGEEEYLPLLGLGAR